MHNALEKRKRARDSSQDSDELLIAKYLKRILSGKKESFENSYKPKISWS